MHIMTDQSPPTRHLCTAANTRPASNVNIEEAFSSLLNAHEILGASTDALSDENEGDIAFCWAYEKLHCPTLSISGSLSAAPISAEANSHPMDAFAVGAAVDAYLKVCILRDHSCLLRFY